MPRTASTASYRVQQRPRHIVENVWVVVEGQKVFCEIISLVQSEEKWLRKSEQGDKWNRCLIEGMIVLSETGARDEQTTPP